jgi:hypothetical protein
VKARLKTKALLPAKGKAPINFETDTLPELEFFSKVDPLLQETIQNSSGKKNSALLFTNRRFRQVAERCRRAPN